VERYHEKDRSLQMLVIDPHSPMKYRVSAVRNLEEFYQAFGIKEDSPIYIPKDKRVSIW
jgi:putative endopeptidase